MATLSEGAVSYDGGAGGERNIVIGGGGAEMCYENAS